MKVKTVILTATLLAGALPLMAGEPMPDTAVDLSAAAPSKFDPAPGWPMVSGPYGNFNPRRYGHQLVDDIDQARLLWKSDTGVLGMGKMFRKGGGKGGQPPGTASGVLVAQGMVFGNGYQPRANGRPLPFEDRSMKEATRGAQGEKLEKLLNLWSVEADDLFVAYDQRTGRTIWQVNEANQGIHRGMAKRSGFHSTPVWHDGKLFGIGTTLRAYAYEAATGRKLWESDLGPAHADQELYKQRCLDARVLPGSGGFASGAVVAAPAGSSDRAVVVMPRYSSSGGDSGLIGFDPATGAVRWEITEGVQSRYAAPAVWSHEGRQYLLTTNQGGAGDGGLDDDDGKSAKEVKPSAGDALQAATGIFRMIDPGTGKVMWNEKIAPMWKPIITSGKYAIVLLPLTKMTPEELKRDPLRAIYACYEISPQGAKKVWAMPDEFNSSTENHMDCGPMREVLIRDGLMIFVTNFGKIMALRLETGEKISEREGTDLHGSYAYFMEDRLFHVRDAAHSGLAGVGFMSLQPPFFTRLAPPVEVMKVSDRATSGYEVLLENPYADGILYLRTQTQGRVNAIDLRKDPPKEAPKPLPLPEWAAKLPEPLRLLASRYRDEREAATVKLIALPVEQRQIATLLELAGHQDHLVRQAAAQVLAASTAGLAGHAEALRKLALQALANIDEDGLELFIPIALAVDAPALIKVLEPAITPQLTDPKQPRLALKALELTGKAGSGMVEKTQLLLWNSNERIVRDAAHTLARIGSGDAKVVAALLRVLGPLGSGDSNQILAVSGAMAALRYLAENQGIPTVPDHLLHRCNGPVKRPGDKGRFGPDPIAGQGGYWQARMLVASRQGAAAVPIIRQEIEAILISPFHERVITSHGFVDAVTPLARDPDIQELLRTIAIRDTTFGASSMAASELLERMGVKVPREEKTKEKNKTPPKLEDLKLE